MSETIILGAGLSGLSCAFHLGSGFRLIERNGRVGGMCLTEVIDGFHFDHTGHWLHLRDPEIRALVDRLMPNAFATIHRVARIYSRGTYTRYPYQVNTFGLPPEVVSECVLGFVEAQVGAGGAELRGREPADFAEFILRYLGTGFAKHFMLPYNQKLYGVHPRELSAAWCGRFVPKPSLKEVIDGALGVGTDAAGYNANFIYPKQGGIEALPRSFLPHLDGPIDLNAEPVSIDWHKRKMTLADGRSFDYRSMVSSIDLPLLIQLIAQGGGVPEDVLEASKRLRATTVTYVNVAAKGKGLGYHWVYFPEPEFPFYRAGSASAAYEFLAPPGHQSFYVEYGNRGGDLDRKWAEAEAVKGLVRCGMLASEKDVLFAVSRDIPNAYVLYDRDYGPAREKILQFLSAGGIETAGRYGRWEYSSMEDAIIAGRDAAARVRARLAA
jgi:protoporphyrinogen oxidase